MNHRGQRTTIAGDRGCREPGCVGDFHRAGQHAAVQDGLRRRHGRRQHRDVGGAPWARGSANGSSGRRIRGAVNRCSSRSHRMIHSRHRCRLRGHGDDTPAGGGDGIAGAFGDEAEQVAPADLLVPFCESDALRVLVASGRPPGCPGGRVAMRCVVRRRPRAGGRPRGLRSGSRCRRSSRRRWPAGCSSRLGVGWSRRRRPRPSRAVR